MLVKIFLLFVERLHLYTRQRRPRDGSILFGKFFFYSKYINLAFGVLVASLLTDSICRILKHHHLYAGRLSPSYGHGDDMSFIFCSNLAHIIKFKIPTIESNRELTIAEHDRFKIRTITWPQDKYATNHQTRRSKLIVSIGTWQRTATASAGTCTLSIQVKEVPLPRPPRRLLPKIVVNDRQSFPHDCTIC